MSEALGGGERAAEIFHESPAIIQPGQFVGQRQILQISDMLFPIGELLLSFVGRYQNALQQRMYMAGFHAFRDVF